MRLNRIVVCGIAAILLTAASAYFWRAPSKHIVALLSVEYLILLPATVYALRPAGSAPGSALPRMNRGAFLIGFLVVALAASWLENQGMIISDENGYSFQARIFASGNLWVTPPPGAPAPGEETPVALYFEHHMVSQDRWLTVYPGGWPALLAAAQLLHVPWAANPLAGLVLLLLTAAIAGRLYDRNTATLAVIMGVLSPYFWINSIGRMSHTAAGALLAAACLFCFEGLRTRRTAAFAWMFAFMAVAFQVRPYTAAVIGGTLGLAALWYLRGDRIRIRLLGMGFLCCAACAGSFLVYTKLTAGSYLHSPYLYYHSAEGDQVVLSVAQIFHNLTHQTRWSLQETVFYTFPFVVLLAAYAVWREKEHQREARILGVIVVTLVLSYLIQPGVNAAEFIGERYYFEGFFAVLILAARGAALLVNGQRAAQKTVTAVLLLLIGLQVCQLALAAPVLWDRITPYRRVRAAAGLLSGHRYTVFLQGSDEPFVGKHFNLNRADWQNGSLMFLVDPGPAERNRWACRMGRPEWVAIRYDQALSAATEEFGNGGSCADK